MKRPATRQRDIQKHLMRSLGCALVERERLITTLTRAKTLRPMAEQWMTLAKHAATGEGATRLAHERRLRSEIQSDTLVRKLITDLAKRTAKRQGGYTRILRLGYRVGDAAPKALIELVDRKPAGEAGKPTKTSSMKKAAVPAKAASKKPAVTKK